MFLLNSWSVCSACAMFADFFFFFKVSMELKKFPLSHNRFFGTFCNYLMCAVVFIQAYGWNYFNPSASVRAFIVYVWCLLCMLQVYLHRLYIDRFKRCSWTCEIVHSKLNVWNCSYEVYMLHGSSINNLCWTSTNFTKSLHKADFLITACKLYQLHKWLYFSILLMQDWLIATIFRDCMRLRLYSYKIHICTITAPTNINDFTVY